MTAKTKDPMPVRALAPWFGGKRTMAPAIVAELGPHTQYFEPFCGSKNGFPERAPIRCGCGNPIVADTGCVDSTGTPFCEECKEGFDGE